jgi:hypothetical protein
LRSFRSVVGSWVLYGSGQVAFEARKWRHRLIIIGTARPRFQIVHVLESTAIVTHFVCVSFANPVPTGHFGAIGRLKCGQFGAICREISGFLPRHFKPGTSVIRQGAGAARVESSRALGTNSPVRGTIGTKKGSASSAGATLAHLHFPSRSRSSASRTGFEWTRASPAQKNKARLGAAGLIHSAW